MALFRRKKKIKEKRKRNPYLISAKLTLAVVFLLIIGFTLFDLGKYLKTSSSDLSDTLSIVKEEVDTSKLTTSNAITEENEAELTSSLKEKMKDVNLDLLTDDEIDKNKFKHTDISISKDFTISDQEFTILFNSLVKSLSEGEFVDNFLEVTITKDNESTILYTVLKLNLDDLLNSIDGLKGLQIYITNSYELKQNGNLFTVLSYSCRVNNLTYEESSNIIGSLDTESESSLNIAEISFHFFSQFINNFTYNTSSFITIDDHMLTFSLSE